MYSLKVNKMQSNDECLIIDYEDRKVCFLENNQNIDIKLSSINKLEKNEKLSVILYINKQYHNSALTTSNELNLSNFLRKCSIDNNTSMLITIIIKKLQKIKIDNKDVKTSKDTVDNILDMPFFDSTKPIEPIKKNDDVKIDYKKKHEEEKKRIFQYYNEQDNKKKDANNEMLIVIDDNDDACNLNKISDSKTIITTTTNDISSTCYEIQKHHQTIKLYLTHISKIEKYIV